MTTTAEFKAQMKVHDESHGKGLLYHDCPGCQLANIPEGAMNFTPQGFIRAIVGMSRAIDATYVGKGLCREAIDRRRWDKIGEELGEVGEAYALFVGENPRKPGTGDIRPVLAELLDVAICALGAWVHLVDSYPEMIPVLGAEEVLAALSEQTCRKRTRLLDAIAAALPDLRAVGTE